MSKSIAIPSTNQLHQSATALAARFRKRYTEAGDFTLDVDLSTPAGFTILFGASGAGKTTLLDCIAGLASPDAGTIQIGAQLFFESETRFNFPIAKRNVGYVFQDLALFPHLTVAGNIAYGLDRFPARDRQRRIT